MLYRARPSAEYGPLAPVLRQNIREAAILRHWEDLNRLAASLKDGLMLPSLVVAKLQSLRRQNPLQQAIQELGRIAKTRHILGYIDDEQLRRRVLLGLNKQESLHAMARTVLVGAILTAFPEPSTVPGRRDRALRRIGDRVEGAGTKLIVLDDAHELLIPEKESATRRLLDLVATVMEKAHVAVAFVGRPECEELFDLEPRLVACASPMKQMNPFSWDGDRHSDFCNWLDAVDGELPLADSSGLGDLDTAVRLYAASGGVVGALSRIIKGAARLAISDGSDCVTHDHLAAACPDRSSLRAFHSGQAFPLRSVPSSRQGRVPSWIPPELIGADGQWVPKVRAVMRALQAERMRASRPKGHSD